MNSTDIQTAITKAQKGIGQYLELMDLVHKVDVSTDSDFQRKYNAFYRVQRRQESWYRSYYALMQQLKTTHPTFPNVLDAIHSATGRYEPSFASKLVATLDPSKPVWDVHVLANTNHQPPSYVHKAKLSLAKTAYDSIEQWYAHFLTTTDGLLCIAEFNSLVPSHQKITDIKKIDFILWQTRPARPKKPRHGVKNAT